MSLSLGFELSGLDMIRRRLEALSLSTPERLLKPVGEQVLLQTKRRIRYEKRSPEGVPWAPWSSAYASKRHSSGQGLLLHTRHLLDSLTLHVQGKECRVGTNLKYAATHQRGNAGRNIPKRPFLGISSINHHELEALCERFVRHELLGEPHP